ncbi:hypothetical protein EPUS_01717 [Endocarpon pusillum Z07020]|uniref:Uncharacterized protein n=1 Tax=Endocarpon pusillum (strain Z07020 / HMAS-L-300199) TaxID=1263415 RepID=U1G3C7_ENDPU|nr:uncharacterized protein EPUS_01717 [Endocarpon pusillum Z07020]ERF71802.1 hypothetical protein EPUS_01717 [Endocarpon pusillum Z07020]
MALTPGLMLRSTSPATSDDSPQRGRRGRELQDETLTKDKAFRRYVAGVDRALGLFDATLQEWADYISFLSRLLKAFHTHPGGITLIPRKYLVAKRLAQCMHPSLPSGVHQKALEVCKFIFGLIGKDGLAEDLAVYLPGIASTLTFASISVRSLFLSLIEEYVLKLPTSALRPAVKALILALLPGLEEESSDEFEKTIQLLNRFKHTFGSVGLGQVFWQNLFLASITSPSRRQGVLVYLSRYLPKLSNAVPDSAASVNDEDSKSVEIAAVTIPEPGLLLRCFATGLADEQMLVQRGFLDLLVTHLPLHASLFRQHVLLDDLQLLMSAAVGVVLRRDMSLNRRLWSWFMGPEQKVKNESIPSSPDDTAPVDGRNSTVDPDMPSYYQTYGVQTLTQSLQSMIKLESRTPSTVSRPFRIGLSLMDQWEIGNSVINVVFLSLIRSLHAYQQIATSREEFGEVFRSANVFFDGVESTLIWSRMLGLVLADGKAKGDILHDLDLATFVISNFNVREEEMVVLHIPLVSLAMLENLSQVEEFKTSNASPVCDREVQCAMFHVLTRMIDMIPERAFTSKGSSSGTPTGTPTCAIKEMVKSFFDHNQDAAQASQLPIFPTMLGQHFLQLLTSMITKQMRFDTDGSDLSRSVQVLSLLLTKLPSYDGLGGSVLVRAIEERLALEAELPFAVVSSATALVTNFLVANPPNHIIQADDVLQIVPLLVRRLWTYLSFSSPQQHIETVQLLEDIQHLVWKEELVTSTILGLLVGADADLDESYHPNKEAFERFATLWSHSHKAAKALARSNGGALASRHGVRKGLTDDHQQQSTSGFSSMLSQAMISVLNVLRGPETEVYVVCRDWLQNLADLSRVFDTVIASIKKSLSSDTKDSASLDKIEAGSDLMDVLNQLVATQSRDQWVRFALQPGTTSNNHQSFKARASGTESVQTTVAKLCQEVIQKHELHGDQLTFRQILRLQRATLNLLRQLFSRSNNEPLIELQIDHLLVAQLGRSVVLEGRLLQSDLLDTLLILLTSKVNVRREREAKRDPSMEEERPEDRPKLSNTSISSRITLSTQQIDTSKLLEAPDDLLTCLLKGIANSSSRDVIHKWVQLVCESIYFYTSYIFNILMKMVETFCKQIELCFVGMKAQYEKESLVETNFETPLSHLLNGLDFVLARAHEQLLAEEDGLSTNNSPEPQQGFFGAMVSGSLSRQARNNTNNNRLTVILCFQDALNTCFNIWSWQSLNLDSSDTLASFQFASQKIRGRSRRILEHLLSAEPLESIEALAHIWVKAIAENDTIRTESLLGLVHTLEGSRPGITMPAIFNAIYSRTHPSVLVLSQKSTLSSNLTESDLVAFLSVYAQSLEDDVLEEIWKDCTTFLRDVLGNPMPHRQILIRLIHFIAILGGKMENTNFGEERKMRRELADLFIRLLTAIFTIKPQSSSREKTSVDFAGFGSDTVEQALDQNFAAVSALLEESDRLVPVITHMVSNIITPLFRSRQFPQIMTLTSLNLLLKISKIQNASKAWKKELTDSFNDPKFFSSPLSIVKDGWLQLLRQLAFIEKTLLPELLSRLNSPTAAGIMFGVGATAARLEADKKAQLNLRRICCIVLAVEYDTFATHLSMLQAKLEELFTASSISSPSSTTRTEIYMVIRALILKSSAGQMASFWPLLNTELRPAFSSIYDDNEDQTYNNYSLLQAAKLLDVLLLTNPEDFQPQEWLFVTDTVDAVYRPEDWHPTALIDEVAQAMMENAESNISTKPPLSATVMLAPPDENDHNSLRKPWLSGDQTRNITEAEIPEALLRPFFGQLSIHVYERTYSLSEPDMEACREDLLRDLFDERTLVGS